MIETDTNFLDERLAQRQENGLLRTLVDKNHLVDFCSNDYLGMARSEKFKQLIASKLEQHPEAYTGATGSRLISGNLKYAEQLEQKLADFHEAPAGLLFNSGYDANVGIFASLARRGDTIITDELAHASMIDGSLMSNAQRFRFKHNDLTSLEKKLKLARGNVFVGIESVYSMDGDMAPMREIIELCEKHGAHVIIDEAHATGLFCSGGEGAVEAEGLQKRVLARIHTFGKAVGCHGAIVVGSNTLREYLINFSRSFIYTTALPFHSLVAIEAAYELFPGLVAERQHLKNLIASFQYQLSRPDRYKALDSYSPIQGVLVPGNAEAKALAQQIEQEGLYVKAILSPTVPAGQERLRICLHAFNTEGELCRLTDIIRN